MAMILGTVLHRASVLAVTLDGALEAFALGHCGNIDLVAFCKDVSLDLVAELIVGSVLKTELLYMLFHGNTGLFEMTLHSPAYTVLVSNDLFAGLILGGDSFLCFAVANLNSFVAVVVYSLDLGNNTGACLKDSYRYYSTVFFEDLCHTDFCC